LRHSAAGQAWLPPVRGETGRPVCAFGDLLIRIRSRTGSLPVPASFDPVATLSARYPIVRRGNGRMLIAGAVVPAVEVATTRRRAG